MTTTDDATLFRAHRVVHIRDGRTVDGPAEVLVRDGYIVSVTPWDPGAEPRRSSSDAHEGVPAGTTVITLDPGEVLLPGLVDTHVHVNEPGRTEWEGYATATRAAAAGGVTTLIDMPLNSVPSTVTMEALALKRATAAEKARVNVGFWGGAVPETVGTGELRRLWETGRVFGFKCFLLHSGVDEFRPLDRGQLAQAMAEIAEFDGLLIVHAEDPDDIAAGEAAVRAEGGITEVYATFEASRPPSAEARAIETVIATAEATGCRVHILHLSDSGSLDIIREAQECGVRITAETCPHYLALFSEEIQNGATQYKCCPPVRTAGNRERLWKGLVDGIIGMVVSDHSPCTAELKKFAEAARDESALDGAFSALSAPGNDLGGQGADGRGTGGSFGEAWGGVSSVQLGLPVVWSQARLRGLALTDVVDWMARLPAEWVGLPDRGAIEEGRRADLVAVRSDDAFVVLPERLHQRNKVTAYAQRALAGVVTRTWIGGELVYRRPVHTGDGGPGGVEDAQVFPGPVGMLVDRP
ncbi:allantoinase AllB [Corynebacterium bovis]|uniref:allantoinase AllB n=1 Tax=Corynebacterium bovis TaxID=36808 RepID=UPI000F6364F3|nr:allantoinase AllB [Corynebacterium bovis]MDN8578553.1 allantoinase AllB [Corynebacterium bovis]RRO89595.1 allantoinase AllB [Corynebacterium bovis]